MQNKWRLPGGGIKRTELPEVAITREAKEEIGLNISPAQYKKLSTQPIRSTLKYNYDLYVVKLNDMPTLTIDKKEILQAKFFNKKDITTDMLSDEAYMALRLLGWYK